jgi:transcriptional regulator
MPADLSGRGCVPRGVGRSGHARSDGSTVGAVELFSTRHPGHGYRWPLMYLPKHFQATDAQTRTLLDGIRAADLITPTAQGLWATFLALLHTPNPDGTVSLHGHVARRNNHWRLTPTGESLVIVRGPEGYISPSWYPSKREHGKVVPTWNYLTAHVHEELMIHDDPVWLEAVVRRRTERHEAEQPHPWAVDDAPRPYIEGQLRAIVGVELRITRVEAKAKLGLHRGADDVAGTIAGLRTHGTRN